MARPTLRSAISFINRHGALLVFPIKNRPDVPSLWKCFHPRTAMNWDWSEDGSDQVPELWHLREELSRCGKVAYAKWFQGRATFFSLEVFTAILSCFASLPDPLIGLDEGIRRIHHTLADDSPLPTRALRELSGFDGRDREAAFQRGLRALWSRLLIVGYGEVEEGGFPSLAVGLSRHLFEEQWDEARILSVPERDAILTRAFTRGSPFEKFYRRIVRSAESLSAEQLAHGTVDEPATLRVS